MTEFLRRRRFALANSLVTSRLLILQSKRLALNSTERRFRRVGTDSLRTRVEQLRLETATAQHQYRSTVLEWASPDHEDFWVVAYSQLIEKGHLLNDRLREAIVRLPAVERYQVAADIEIVEGMVQDWTDSMRRAMATSVA